MRKIEQNQGWKMKKMEVKGRETKRKDERRWDETIKRTKAPLQRHESSRLLAEGPGKQGSPE